MRNLVLNFWERLGFAVRLPVGMILAVWGFTCWLAYFDTVKAILGFDSSQDPLLSFHFVGVALAAFVCLVIPFRNSEAVVIPDPERAEITVALK